MRIIFIGCVEFSRVLLARVLTLPDVKVVGIITREASGFNTDFCSLKAQADELGIPCLIDKGNDQEAMTDWMNTLAPDVAYCFGWPYILNSSLLKIPSLGVVGYHPTALPKNRGRHPVIWTLVLGLEETASSFFFMDEGADSGDIISQKTVSVGVDENAGTLYEKLQKVALQQVEEMTRLLASKNFVRMTQDHSKANYWRKRHKPDGRIDWRMSSKTIYNLVRGSTKPYAGAHVEIAGEEIKVWESNIPHEEYSLDKLINLEPGLVLASSKTGLDIRCGDGVIRLVTHEFKTLPEAGVYL